MNRVYLPLLPLPVLAVLVAVSACHEARTEEPTPHVIPPAMALPPPEPPRAPVPEAKIAAGTQEDAPSAEDVKEFHRKVSK